MSGTSKARLKSLDTFGVFAYSMYIVVGGFLVFGFAYALKGAVEKQQSSLCRILRPELRTRVRGTVLRDGAPVSGAQINPGPDGKSSIVSDEYGGFVLMLPEGPADVTVVTEGNEPVEVPLEVPASMDLEVNFEVGAAPKAATTSSERFMAPEIEAQDLNGNPVSLSDYRGQFVIVNFWATWCEPCITEWPQLHQLAQRMAGRDDVVVLAVSIDDEKGKILPFLERMTLIDTEVDVVWDPTSEVHTTYGSSQIPDTFFVNEDGELVSAFVNVRKWGQPEAFHCVDGSIGR